MLLGVALPQSTNPHRRYVVPFCPVTVRIFIVIMKEVGKTRERSEHPPGVAVELSPKVVSSCQHQEAPVLISIIRPSELCINEVVEMAVRALMCFALFHYSWQMVSQSHPPPSFV